MRRILVPLLWFALSAPAWAAPQAWVTDTLTRIELDSKPPESPSLAADVMLARNEFESIQIGIVDAEADLKSVRLENVDFPLPIQHFVVGYIKAGAKRFPDMLLPAKQFDAAKANTSAMVVIVYAPKDAKPGNYAGALRVTAEGAAPIDIKLKATVWDFALPDGPGKCRTAFALQEGREKWTHEQRRVWADFMLDYRLNPDDIYRHQPPRIEDLEHYYERGLNYFTICKVAKGWGAERLRPFFAELDKSKYSKQLRKLGYVYGYDEKPKATWEDMGACFKALKEEFPDVRTSTTAHVYMDWPDPVALMKQYSIDAIAPWIHPGYPEYYKYEDGVKVRAAGLELWAYNINFQTHYPAIQPRTTMWQMYWLQADGWLYYAMNGWNVENPPSIDPAAGPLVDYEANTPNSQGELLYRGKDGPIASLRIANIRDGIEDWHYLDMLATKLGSVDKAREACKPVCWGALKWTDDPKLLQATRKAIAEQLTQRQSR